MGRARKPFMIPGRGPFAQSRTPSESLRGLMPNLMHDSDSHSADVALLCAEAAQAGALAVQGTSQTGDISVALGHLHNSLDSAIDWRDFGGWQAGNGGQGTSVPGASSWGQLITDTARTVQGWAVVALRAEIDSLEVAPRVSIPAPGAVGADGFVTIGTQVFDLLEDPTTPVLTLSDYVVSSVAGGVQVSNKWLRGLYATGLSSLDTQNGCMLVGFRFDAFVSAAGVKAVLWEVRLGRDRR